MPRQVYSTSFALQQITSAPTLPINIPPADTAVVRDLTVVNDAGAATLIILIVTLATGTTVQPLLLSIAATDSFRDWSGRIVVPGGCSIHLRSSNTAGAVDVSCSGYLLRA